MVSTDISSLFSMTNNYVKLLRLKCVYTVVGIISTALLREGGYGIVKRASCGVPFYFSAFLGTGRSSPKMARCAVLIDGGYLDKVQAEDFGNTRVDIGRFG